MELVRLTIARLGRYRDNSPMLQSADFSSIHRYSHDVFAPLLAGSIGMSHRPTNLTAPHALTPGQSYPGHQSVPDSARHILKRLALFLRIRAGIRIRYPPPFRLRNSPDRKS